jgi:hypothetical protein
MLYKCLWLNIKRWQYCNQTKLESDKLINCKLRIYLIKKIFNWVNN